MIVGIDPGISGALVTLYDGAPFSWTLMPSVQIGSASRVIGEEVADWLIDNEVTFAYIENVHSMPKQGVVSTFNFGHATGVVTGVVAALKIPYKLVHPTSWKKRADLIGKDKDAGRQKAMEMWGHWSALKVKWKGQAFADAALIAKYGDKR